MFASESRPGRLPATADERPSQHAFPQRSHLAMALVLFLGVVFYGSFVPFGSRPLEWNEAVQQFFQIPYYASGVRSRADWLANIQLFIPLGFLAMSVPCVDSRSRFRTVAAAMLVPAVCLALSSAIEFAQQWFPRRVPSQNDIIAETIGGSLGVVLWLFVGQAFVDWVRSYTASRRTSDQLGWLLQAYLLGLLVYCLMPLDLTIRPTELGKKLVDGRIVLIPFSDLTYGLSLFYDLLTDIAVFIPVGMLVATAFTRLGALRSRRAGLLIGFLILLAIELAQIFVHSRTASTTDLITGMVGVAIGIEVMRRWRGTADAAPSAPLSGHAKRRLLFTGLVAAYSLILIAIFCAPGDRPYLELPADKAEVRARLEGFFRTPFAGLFTGSVLNALSDVGRKMLFFAVLGILLAMIGIPRAWPPAIRRTAYALLVLYAAGLGAVIELLQVLVPPHVPDMTDVVLYTAGAVIGLVIAHRLARTSMPSGTVLDPPTARSPAGDDAPNLGGT